MDSHRSPSSVSSSPSSLNCSISSSPTQAQLRYHASSPSSRSSPGLYNRHQTPSPLLNRSQSSLGRSFKKENSLMEPESVEHSGLKELPALQYLSENFDKQIILNMKGLNLSYQRMIRIPSELRLFRNLTSLNLSNNRMTVLNSPLIVNNLKELKHVDVSCNKLSNLSEIQTLGLLQKLESLDVRKNPLPMVEQRVFLLQALLFVKIAIRRDRGKKKRTETDLARLSNPSSRPHRRYSMRSVDFNQLASDSSFSENVPIRKSKDSSSPKPQDSSQRKTSKSFKQQNSGNNETNILEKKHKKLESELDIDDPKRVSLDLEQIREEEENSSTGKQSRLLSPERNQSSNTPSPRGDKETDCEDQKHQREENLNQRKEHDKIDPKKYSGHETNNSPAKYRKVDLKPFSTRVREHYSLEDPLKYYQPCPVPRSNTNFPMLKVLNQEQITLDEYQAAEDEEVFEACASRDSLERTVVRIRENDDDDDHQSYLRDYAPSPMKSIFDTSVPDWDDDSDESESDSENEESMLGKSFAGIINAQSGNRFSKGRDYDQDDTKEENVLKRQLLDDRNKIYRIDTLDNIKQIYHDPNSRKILNTAKVDFASFEDYNHIPESQNSKLEEPLAVNFANILGHEINQQRIETDKILGIERYSKKRDFRPLKHQFMDMSLSEINHKMKNMELADKLNRVSTREDEQLEDEDFLRKVVAENRQRESRYGRRQHSSPSATQNHLKKTGKDKKRSSVEDDADSDWEVELKQMMNFTPTDDVNSSLSYSKGKNSHQEKRGKRKEKKKRQEHRQAKNEHHDYDDNDENEPPSKVVIGGREFQYNPIFKQI